MVLSDQIAEAKVLDAIWTLSKDGYLKPRVQTIRFCCGAKIVCDTVNLSKIIILVPELEQAGALEMLPHIVSVIQPASQPFAPSVPYVWNETHVDIMRR